MSKSAGNFFTVRDISEKYDLQVLRFFMLSAHYRSPLNFSDELMEAAKMIAKDTGYRGIYTIGQDKDSSVVYGMPKVAFDIGAVCTQASCENIADVLIRHLKTL